jgi:integrase
MLSLGTTDRKLALKSCVQLNAHMDRMLDENAHITIPEVDVPAFFKAELRTYLEDLRNARMMERMDGTLTATREQHNRVEAFVLRSLVEDGLRENMSEKRLMELPINQRAPAARVQNEKFKEFMSPEFNQAVLERAASKDRIQHMSQHEKLRLRWAAVEARMAAHHAVETVPLHAGESACIAAETMLRALVAPSTAAPHPRDDVMSSQSQTFASAGMGTAVDTSSASDAGSLVSFSDDKTPFLTPGVSLISKRITANRIKTQRNEALAQPEARVFNGNAMDAEIERRFGQDLFGTAVRMTRSKECTQGTKDQALKTVTLFIYVTGIQLVTDIRAHHLEIFSNAIAKEMPKTYWKSPRQRDLTFKEILEEARTLPAAKVGLSPATIERHLVTLKSIIEHAEYEGNETYGKPRISKLIPKDFRTDAEKRAVFTQKDVINVFAHPLWTGCKSRGRRHSPGSLVLRDHHYWINLLLVHTGARRSEIAGLLVEDVLEENGIPYIYIRANHLRGLKNSHSKRRIPLHPELVDLGFLDFIGNLKAKKALVAFPAAIPAKIRNVCLGTSSPPPAYDEKFGDLLDHVWRECLTRSLNGNPECYCLHSLRHYVNDTIFNARDANGLTNLVSDTDRRDLLGHKPLDVNAGTYRRELKPLGPLYEAIKLLPRLYQKNASTHHSTNA